MSKVLMSIISIFFLFFVEIKTEYQLNEMRVVV